VETAIINAMYDNNTPYEDPSGTAGSYSLGMLSIVDDLLALNFDPQGFRYINVAMDISSIGVNPGPGCIASIAIADPIFGISAIDSPSGTPLLSGNTLAQGDMTGTVAPNPWTYLWTRHVVSLDLSALTAGGTVSILFQLLQSGYAAFDNLVITASDTPLSAQDESCSR